jgi:short subunit dehydrogenase-like uncharacterized protein
MVEGLGLGGAIRQDGRLRNVPLAYKTKTIPFRDKPRFCMTIPWGDVSTAYYSTGIPNIEVYTAASPAQARVLKLLNALAPVFRHPLIQRGLKSVSEGPGPGPSEARRNAGTMQLWGAVINAAGERREATLVTREGYAFTADAALESTLRVLRAEVAPGTQTPSTAFGPEFVTRFAGSQLQMSPVHVH